MNQKSLYISHIPVRYYETDKMAVVHHSNYIRYFEVARTESLIHMGLPFEEIERRGYYMPIISVSCRYHLPAVFGDNLAVEVFLASITGVRITFTYEVRNSKAQLLATGETVLAMTDAKTGRPVRLPQFIHDILYL